MGYFFHQAGARPVGARKRTTLMVGPPPNAEKRRSLMLADGCEAACARYPKHLPSKKRVRWCAADRCRRLAAAQGTAELEAAANSNW